MKRRIPITIILLTVACLIVVFGTWLASDKDWHSSSSLTAVIATTSPRPELSGQVGWWNSMPTDPNIPTAPAISLPTQTPTRTPTPSRTPNARTQTVIAMTGTIKQNLIK
jgi:hypothetical protein